MPSESASSDVQAVPAASETKKVNALEFAIRNRLDSIATLATDASDAPAAPDNMPLPDQLDMALLQEAFGSKKMPRSPQPIATTDAAWRLSRDWASSPGTASNSMISPELQRVLCAAFLNVHDADLWVDIAKKAMAEGNFELADASSRRSVLVAPHSSDALAARAASLCALERLDLAGAFAVASIRNSSDSPAAATDVLNACREQLKSRRIGPKAIFEAIIQEAIRIGDKDKAIVALIKGAARNRNSELSSILLHALASGAREQIEQATSESIPLVLVSQIQRSGGSLLAQLFDGHPELFAHPHELHIGRPQKWIWPSLNMEAAAIDRLCELFESVFLKFMIRGYSKSDGNKAASKDYRKFSFDMQQLVNSFLGDASRHLTQRDCIDSYFRAFFSAWREHKASGQEKYVTAFCPRLISYRESVDGFFTDFPDGRLISCIRDPVSWFASSSRHDAEYEDIDHALALWRASVSAALEIARERPTQVYLLTFESLTENVSKEMSRIAHWLGISDHPALGTPTYAKQAVMPNSSFTVTGFGVHASASDRSSQLPKEALQKLLTDGAPLYDAATDAIEKQNTHLFLD